MSQACHNLLLGSLTTYYQKRSQYRTLFHDIVEGLSPLSLRVIDWFVTHYARSQQIIYWIDEQTNELYETYPNNHTRPLRKFHLYLDYRAQLKSYTKLYFDCFRRHERITFVLETEPLKTIETTVGQLNFFRWALQNHVIDYIMNHLTKIEDQMAKYQKSLKQNTAAASDKNKNASGGDSTGNRTMNAVIRAPCHLRFD